LLFKKLATLRIDAPVFDNVDQLRWRGATTAFGVLADKIGDGRLAERVLDLRNQVLNESATNRP